MILFHSWLRRGITVLTMLSLWVALAPSVQAYSYGDPHEEPIAEAYTAMLAALNQQPPDFVLVRTTFDEIKNEILKEFGPEQVDRIEQSIQKEDANQLIYEMQVVLVRNVERRLANLQLVFDDYPQAKLLLAKGFATYEALSPMVVSEDPQLDQEIRDAFDEALKALGNPGLFGVGQVPSDRELFEESSAFILEQLKVFFDTDAGYEGHTQGTGLQPSAADEGSSLLAKNWLPLTIILVLVIGALLFFSISGRRRP